MSESGRRTVATELSFEEYFDLEESARSAQLDPGDYMRKRLLDAVRRDVAARDRATRFDCWVMCPSCGDVLHDPQVKLDMVDDPAPCCGATGVRTIWPNAMSSFDDVAEIEMSDERSTRAAVLLQCAACEALLEETLWHLLGWYEPHSDIAIALMARVKGREAMLRLYGEIAGTKIHGVLAGQGYGAWTTAWKELVENRNAIVHGGHPEVSDQDLKQLVTTVHAQAYRAFAALHNAGMKHVRARIQAEHARKQGVP